MPETKRDYETTIRRQFGTEAERVLAEYPIETDADANDGYAELVTDVSCRCPARGLALLASGRDARVWMYSFEEGAGFHSTSWTTCSAETRSRRMGEGYPTPRCRTKHNAIGRDSLAMEIRTATTIRFGRATI
jgi:hypothetical protein